MKAGAGGFSKVPSSYPRNGGKGLGRKRDREPDEPAVREKRIKRPESLKKLS